MANSIRPSSDSVIDYLLQHCNNDCSHCPVFDLCWKVREPARFDPLSTDPDALDFL